MTSAQTIEAPVRASTTVRVNQGEAFRVFTEGFDTWWPRTHHIGSSPMKRAIVEGRAGGRCYTEQEDGTECDWGSVLAWDPPRRLVIAWQIDPQWKFEPDLAKSSEVEITFTALGDGSTRIDLEHRHLERYGAAADAVRKSIGSESGWPGLLALYAKAADEAR